MSNMYPYSPLSELENDIRLIKINPGRTDDNIRCKMHHSQLAETLDFTALSYTWGDPGSQKTIFIEEHAVEVTVNLFDALQHMRHAERPRTIWVDAICINQADDEEKNKQVLRMRYIYAMANSVEVWLGNFEKEDELEALVVIQKIGAVVGDHEEALAHGFGPRFEKYFLEVLENCSSGVVKALCDLFRLPWWTRVWVVQELALAKQDVAVVRCGHMTLPWTDFLITAHAIELSYFIVDAVLSSNFPDERVDSFSNGIRMSQCRRVRLSDPPFTLLELLNQHRDCEATDPRDKVYGLLGLAGDAEAIGIDPNYLLSPQDVFMDLAQRHVSITRSLDIICACRHPRQFDDLPSWVPDWSSDQTIPGICINDRYVGGNDFDESPIAHFEKYAASRFSQPSVVFSGRRMSVSAIIFGKIISLGDVDTGMSFEDVETFGREDEKGKSASGSNTFNQWLDMVLDDSTWDRVAREYGAEKVIDAFCRTLVGDRNNRMEKPPESIGRDGEYARRRVTHPVRLRIY